jgi:hypothetical protein
MNHKGERPLHGAAFAGRYANVQALIEHGAKLNAHCRYDWTCVHLAVAGGHEKVVTLLLENGAEFSVDIDGWTPLHVAVHKGNENIVKLLLEIGATISVKDENRFTAMDWATSPEERLGHLEDRLIQKVMSPSTFTGLRIAAYYGEDARIRQLLKGGADIDGKKDSGWYVLSVAHAWLFIHSRRGPI